MIGGSMKRAILAVASALALTACAGESATEPEPAPTPPAIITPTPTPSPEARRLAIGEGSDYGDFRTTVKEQKVTRDGITVQAFLVQTCNQGSQAERFGASRWELRDSDGGRYQAHWITGDPQFEPGYEGPDGPQSVAPGDCVQGWIPYLTDRGTELRYNPQGLAQTVWSLS